MNLFSKVALFYINLYKRKQAEIDDYLDGIHTNNVLSNIEANTCEELILEEEYLNGLNKMSKTKSPGIDGLTAEFYLGWYIQVFVVESFNEAFRESELSEMHKQIIISLIFKQIDSKLYKNYQSISLSNVDYKILAFVLANGLQKVIAKLISPKQVAYIEERYIG